MEIELNKSFKERIFHAVIFEVTANVIIALSLAWLMNVSVLQSGSLSVISALTATVWNFFFNKFFDSLQKKHQFQRTFLVRAIHAVGFETGLIISLIPVAMFMLNLTIAEAFFVEIGLVLFFLPYTMLFNWLYDYLRWTFVGSKRSAV
ncbi:PACE efflux transporter [Enterobacter cloacae complex sp. I1]|uniref:PACE efflux transporter n=1 Tax=unclassified Enterobacter cloacae complex TaxID=2757714 RepID=UPI0018696540|nr:MULTISPECIES: PACE efflux transporter [unclassified Enterobacter cloacae complex]MBE3463306.1 PACE efflux transporter [Enterobacter cloacae complex sp. P20C]MBE3472145.1 PACE efflux transporter [Enterobacter cloacae complex sp. P20B]MBE3493551.1 PACE efflux transporter [Enterobacter cloacae complex sp. P17RS]MBE3505959.1 PACE efflux transporter [Enterobacter cloacae complex sp. I10]MBE3524685.1 PACE efflux transporter [Enterobacter cloacae complex sp. I9]